jgi:hypothetical protein
VQRFFAYLDVTKQVDGVSPIIAPPPATGTQATASSTTPAATTSVVPTVTESRINPSEIALTAAGDIRGGGTGREHLINLHHDSNEAWNKWVHLLPGKVFRSLKPISSSSSSVSSSLISWVEGAFTHPKHLTKYRMKSANDCPNRDPYIWDFYGIINQPIPTELRPYVKEGKYLLLHRNNPENNNNNATQQSHDEEIMFTRSALTFDRRFQWLEFPIDYTPWLRLVNNNSEEISLKFSGFRIVFLRTRVIPTGKNNHNHHHNIQTSKYSHIILLII